MTKDEKKELFLIILETWFNQNDGTINHQNCIGFYHYLLDCIEFEAHYIPEEEDGFRIFLFAIIDILTDFPQYKEYSNKDIGVLLIDKFPDVDCSKLDIFLDHFNELYCMFREEYLL